MGKQVDSHAASYESEEDEKGPMSFRHSRPSKKRCARDIHIQLTSGVPIGPWCSYKH